MPERGKEEKLHEKTMALMGHMEKTIPNFDFVGALTKIWEVIGVANKYIEDSKPWNLAKENKIIELSNMIYALLETLRIVAIAIGPVMPDTSKQIFLQLGLDPAGDKNFEGLKSWGLMKPGTKVTKSGPLFPRIDVKK